MTQSVINPHGPKEERTLSNVGHWIEGAILTSGGLALLHAAWTGEARHDTHAGRIFVGAGTILAGGLIAGSFHHGGSAAFFSADHQQRQHLQMAGLVLGAGLLRRGRFGSAVSDLLLGAVGRMFLTHEQHGTDEAAREAVAKHRVLGTTIVAGSAIAVLADTTRWRSLKTTAAVLLTAAGAQLLFYREPAGAFEADSSSDGHH